MGAPSGTGLNESYVSRIIQSAFRAPEIVGAIVKGSQAPEKRWRHYSTKFH